MDLDIPSRISHKSRVVRSWPGLVAAAAAAGLIFMFALISARRLEAYSGPTTIWLDALAHQPDNYLIYSCLGEALLAENQTAAAVEHLRSAVKLNPNYASAQSNLGEALVRAGHADEALEHFHRALQIKPDFADAHYNLANALAAAGRQQEAVDEFQAALRYKRSALIHNNLGASLSALGRVDEAAEQFQQTVHLTPDDVYAWANLATTLAQAQRYPAAIEAAQTALRLARARGQADLAQWLERNLAAYRAGQSRP